MTAELTVPRKQDRDALAPPFFEDSVGIDMSPQGCGCRVIYRDLGVKDIHNDLWETRERALSDGLMIARNRLV